MLNTVYHHKLQVALAASPFGSSTQHGDCNLQRAQEAETGAWKHSGHVSVYRKHLWSNRFSVKQPGGVSNMGCRQWKDTTDTHPNSNSLLSTPHAAMNRVHFCLSFDTISIRAILSKDIFDY